VKDYSVFKVPEAVPFRYRKLTPSPIWKKTGESKPLFLKKAKFFSKQFYPRKNRLLQLEIETDGSALLFICILL
jgi:hypothetical protein